MGRGRLLPRETFIDLRSILERHKIPPAPDCLVTWDVRTWHELCRDADLLDMRCSDIVRLIVERYYEGLASK